MDELADNTRVPESPAACDTRDDASSVDMTPSADAAEARHRRLGVLFSLALVVYALDLVSKVIVVATLSNRPPVRLLGGLLTFTLIRNSGAAFSIGAGMTVLFALIAVAVIVVILRLSRQLYSTLWAVSFGLLLGGALGNLTDRVFRSPGVLRGSVVDFIQLPHWAVFNLADSAIVIGGCLMVLLSFRGVGPDGRRHEQRARS